MMQLVLLLLPVLLLASLSLAQFPGGRILEPPVPKLCAQRPIHERFHGKGYFFSWKDPVTKNQEEDWLGVRNWCRMRCMDAVSLQTSQENEYIKRRMVEAKIRYIWTSGRLCDFKGCDRADLQPRIINGWFWTADLQKLPASTNRIQNDWGPSGGIGRPQPDNREELQNGAAENCLAILNNFYGDGIHWHDVACHHRKPFVCEESSSLIEYAQFTNPELKIA
uniref:C-type lectin domain-containing protein n=1 Tax=Clastoptera arizonana TaxID=38151 RepID=A0A1B6CVR4_9HEMI